MPTEGKWNLTRRLRLNQNLKALTDRNKSPKYEFSWKYVTS